MRSRDGDAPGPVGARALRELTSPTEIDRKGIQTPASVGDDAASGRITFHPDLSLQSANHLEQADRSIFFSDRHSPVQDLLAEPRDVYLVPLVMNKFSCDIGRGADNSIFNTIPHVISKAEEGSALYGVCNAIGCALIANTTRYPEATRDQARTYGTALAAVNLDIQDPQRYKSDNTLLGVWLLSLYEVRYLYLEVCQRGFLRADSADTIGIKLLFGARSGVHRVVGSSEWDIHSQGLTKLVLLRGVEQLKTKEGRNLFWIVINTLVSPIYASQLVLCL